MMAYSKLNDIPTKFDYSKLLWRIKEHYGKQGVFAAAVGLSERSVSLKLNNIRGWTQQEIIRCCDVLMIPYAEISDYFFTVSVHKCE
jgi:hypothetical protein